MAVRLYHQDAYQREFQAAVTGVRRLEGGTAAVALEATAFYPAAGGQPADTGRLDGLQVADVREEDGEIWHIVESPAAAGEVAAPLLLQPGSRAHGVLDWERRFDHMQQHTGQHILSQAFLRTLGAETVSVHMGATCTLDLAATALEEDDLVRAEDLANAIVMENRPVTAREVDPEEAAALGLRRPPRQAGRIRVVEVAEFDRSACGGTHVCAAGEVGAIAILRHERHKGGARVEFHCGWRALRHSRWARGVIAGLAGQFTVGGHEVADAVARLQERTRDLERALNDARARLIEHEARALVAAAGLPGVPGVVAAAFEGRPFEELRVLARAVTAQADCVAAFATDPDRRLLVARSPGVAVDAAAVLRETVTAFGGRGGGRAEAAEGIAPGAPSAAALVEAARLTLARLAGARLGA